MQSTAYPFIIAVFSISISSSVQSKLCCPSGKQLHPLLSCPTNPAPLINWETQNIVPKPHPGSFFERFDEADACISHAEHVHADNEELMGLPKCPVHSMVSICDVKVQKNGSRVYQQPKTKTCHHGDCHFENVLTENRAISLDDVCLEHSIDSITAVACPCLHSVCVRKCCPPGELLDTVLGSCIKNDMISDWKPNFQEEGLKNDFFLFTNSFPPRCENVHLLKINHNYTHHSECFSEDDHKRRNDFIFNADGSVQVNKYKFSIDQEGYCGEHTLHENGTLIVNNLLICLPEHATGHPVKFDVYGALLIIGGFILGVTVIVSCYLPELRGTLYHRVTICHNVALMVASFTWGTANLLPTISYPPCVILSLVIQFTFLSSFFWMNVMCIDIALAFKHLRSLYGPAGEKGWKRFVWYSVYAWGTPLALTTITAAMELSPSISPIFLRPGFGCRNCGFNPETYAILIYFYGPMIFILLFNFSLFVMTLLRIRQVEKQTAILKSKGREGRSLRCTPDTQRVVLFGKMFILMGLTWGTEVIGWWVGGPAAYWYLPDLINFLRSVFIFVVFTGKKSVWQSLRQKLMGRSGTVESRTRRSKSSSVERRDAETERRGRILAKQITQTFRMSSND